MSPTPHSASGTTGAAAATPGAASPAPPVPVADISDTGFGTTPIQQAMALAREHGPVFRRRFGTFESLLVGSVDAVTELCDDERFVKAVGPVLTNVRQIAGDGLFTAYNDEPNWAKAHDILLPAFALSSMHTYHPTMLRVAKRLIAAWDTALADGAPVDVADDMTRMTLDTIGLAGFGYDFGSFRRGEPHPFVAAMVRGLLHSQALLSRKADDGVDHSAADEAFRADNAYLAQVVDEVIEARRASGETGTDDLLGLMLGAPHPSDGTPLDAANIRNQVITFLIAGHETTSGALSFALYYLAKNPAVLRRAQAEVDALWGDDPDPEPDYTDVGRLTYVRQVLNEALRLWPTAAAFGRQAVTDTVLDGRVPMRAGDTALVLTPVLHRDPVWGDNVEAFDPERFSPEREAARPVHAFKPFGTGERACIGRQFALHEAVMLLGMLIHRYRFLDHADYRLRVRETLTLKPDGFTLKLARRTSADRVRTVASRAAEGTAGQDAGLPTTARPGTTLTVLHGSNLGACREFAAGLADLGERCGFETTVAPLDAYRAGDLPRTSPVVVVAASYNGRPTDDAAGFVSWLEQAGPGAADGVRYAVLGVGDRNWAATYQKVPTLIDERLAECGATRLLERAAADAAGDLAGTVRGFGEALRRALLAEYGDPDSVGAVAGAEDGYEVTEVTGGPLDALAARHEVVAMTVTETGDLADLTHPLGRSKRFVRLALPDGATYRTGDHLAVLPANDPALVERAARLLGADPDTVLGVRARRPGRGTLPVDRPVTVRELLTYHLELSDPATAAQIAVLADRNPCPPEQAELKKLAPGRASVLDLVERYPALTGRLDWPTVLGTLLPQIRIRHYSVSSSPAVSPGHVDLMVSLLEADGRRGTGSGHLHRVRPGDVVYARVAPCREAFRIAAGDEVPVVMVAAGTGLAPFRGAVADRVALRSAGRELAPALLYFGCDHPEVDFLHAAELRGAEAAGAVSLRPAFSAAPDGDVRFVQHRIAAEADEVWSLLKGGARVYVCGDGSRMAPGVREAFTALYASRTGATAEQAAGWLADLVARGRYVEDVYAAG
ncbi:MULTISPECIES: cytochrome P450 [Streptomycetaceae]|uniref:Bifunctional cytochrome P450/NADPH--P450 reductase n=1 Tax=Streptantibioticus cattleyicolor (strain ATCC 35852 / DSM 46488 / JCM 4925 / NBRC 14057 / NRRL 8057) TaxID=1003195 RepID=F8JYI6_STREN|nr:MULTISPECIES: cytochrome P450 [Streptomycetaceae]AEW97204.1 bifunctional P-450:NADPH-P450 reductase 1 [Streptantibioticus cattleyicolor NRRL 8057 = DSM 46488]MYS61659.1 cytochrome P450 [Streptomyces sp. SID5468]CCB77526.1 Bifunctional P-450/NADPH-P450 reductase [Includes: Cytochrome P450 102; NADPH--cytochrome P450 reductase] [Streptantibioticus cattleyicolor NRRL 8057 = DSM 46488]